MRKSSPPFLTPQTTFLPPFTFPSVISTADENNLKSFPVFCEQCGLCLSHWTKLSHSGTGFPLLKGSCVSQVNSGKRVGHRLGRETEGGMRRKPPANRDRSDLASSLSLSHFHVISNTPTHTPRISTEIFLISRTVFWHNWTNYWETDD